jgi:REP element-mobilizing transposase RayT
MSPSKRLKERDYSTAGFYFVTICANYKRCIFGRVTDCKVEVSPVGHIAHSSWAAIPVHFVNVKLHAFAVMPNHFHGIIQIVGCGLAGSADSGQEKRVSLPAGSVSVIVRSFKAEVTRRARLELNWAGEIWQRNYFDRVIRDGREFDAASRYISENPLKWEMDKENLRSCKRSDEKILAQHAVPLQRNGSSTN